MPLYDLYCDKCGFTKEQMLGLDEKEPVCDKCGKQMKKAMSSPVFILKGNCWSKDNYSRGSKRGDNKNG